MKLYKHIHHNFLQSVVLSLLIGSLSACSDEIQYGGNNKGPEGEEASISLSLSLGDMTKLTRASLSDDDANRVTTLWVGIYNANTKNCTFNALLHDGEHGFKSGVKDHTNYTLTDIDTKSGDSYIVAVANPHTYKGITLDDNTSKPLSELLESAKSWDDYKSIIVTGEYTQDGSIVVQTPAVSNTSGLLMSGIYSNNTNPNHPVDQETSVYISAGNNVKLNGAIHLRRLLSHITFNLQADGTIIDLQPLSYKVYNVSYTSWLHEHTEGTVNSGDALEPEYDKNHNYPSSLLMTSAAFTKEEVTNGNDKYTFDFWQLENKRRGLDMCDDYKVREREYGKDGVYNPTDDQANYGETGLFVSLTPFSNPSLNNKATYVEIPCVVTYRAVTDKDTAKPGAIDNNGDLLGEGAVRTANITYRIHLGYIENDPKDFNTYRNSEYTYNVTIKDLSNVIVEAFREGDEQPGAFGDVTDVSDKFIRLDAHYGVFNIEFTDKELQEFSFRMISYENNKAFEVKGGLEFGGLVKDVPDKYYNWVSLMKTTGEGDIQLYPEDKSKLLHLGDFIPKSEGVASQNAGWYTVFVDEYVYEDSDNENNWKNYVNQPDRMFWLNVAQRISADGASSFYQAKYAAAQRSIQTYYDVNSDATTAIGVEHENENFGFNIRWTNAVSTSGLNGDNGRYNVWKSFGSENPLWDSFVNRKALQKVNAITNASVQNYITEEQKNGGYRNVHMMVTLNSGVSGNLNTSSFSNSAVAIANSTYDPHSGTASQYIQAMFSCMNRNRDENGDGVIQRSELKWYLPSAGKYLRVILGRNSLSTPIMSYSSNESLPFGGASGGANGIFHLISSDGKIIWADEGLSTSMFTSAPYATAPWHVRCIRNLGTNLGAEITNTTDDGVKAAYTVHTTGVDYAAVIKPTRYYGTALRTPSDRALPLHKTNSDYNKLGRYGFEVAFRGNSATSNLNADMSMNVNRVTNYENAINNPATVCNNLNTTTGKTGWRVPNQKELAIMLRIPNLLNITYTGSGLYFWGCTTEYWDTSGSATDVIDLSKNRICTITQSSSGDKTATANLYNVVNRIRCVRDLQAGEYSDLK